MGNHKGCPYGRLVGAYFVAMTGKGTELWLQFPFCLPLSAPGGEEIVVDCMAVADTRYGPARGR